MSKNLIPKIAKMLGVELGEEFKVGNNNVKFWFDLDGLHSEEFETADLTFYRLARGDAEIVKLPWKPKKEERCWYIITDPDCDNEESLIAVEDWWYGSFDEQIALKAGVVYRTRAEAEAALPAVAAELGVEFTV